MVGHVVQNELMTNYCGLENETLDEGVIIAANSVIVEWARIEIREA